MRLVMVPFDKEVIAAYQAPDGAISAHLKWLCGALGVAYPPQFRKLVTGGDTYRWHHRTRTLDGDRRRRCVLLAVECLPIWLLFIHVRKVAADVGQRLIRFQLEAQQALFEYFQSGRATPARPAPPPLALPAPPTLPPQPRRESLLEAIGIALRMTGVSGANPPARHDR